MKVSRHAKERIQGRSIPKDAVEMAMHFGRSILKRGAEIFAIGRKEVKKFMRLGIDISRFEGVQVVCVDDTVCTVYRNRDFGDLRPNRGRRRRVKAW